MADFNPDQYLAEKTSQPQAAGFDPDKYLSEKGVKADAPSALDYQIPYLGGTPRGYIKGALDTLPTAGAVGGGLVGGAAGTLAEPGGGTIAGGIAGAGLGAGMGSELKRMGNKYILGEEQSSGLEHAKDTAGEAAGGVANEVGGQIVGKGIEAAAGSKLGQKAISAAGNAASKVGEAVTGVPDRVIRTYAKHADEIAEMSKASDDSVADAADTMRRGFSDSIQRTKTKLNDQISDALTKSDKTVNVDSTIAALNNVKSQLNPDIHGKDIDQIDNIIDKIKNRTIPQSEAYSLGSNATPKPDTTSIGYENKPITSVTNGKTPATTVKNPYSLNGADVEVPGANYKVFSPDKESIPVVKGVKTSGLTPNIPSSLMKVQDAHELKQYMQGLVSDSYKKPGEIFTSNSGADRAVKSGAANLRSVINEAEPTVAKANESLSELHDIDDSMNSNMIKEGKPEAALMSAGTGGNERNMKSLKRLGDLTGTDMQGEADKLAAMRSFKNPGLSPTDQTGKSLSRTGAGAGIGAAIGHFTGVGAIPGAAVGGALSSPLALKAAINSGRITGEQVKGLLASPAGRQLLGASAKGLIGSKNGE